MKENNKISKEKKSRISRRDFMGAAAAAAAFTVVPRHVLGGAGQTPPSEKLNLAAIGIGGMVGGGIFAVPGLSVDLAHGGLCNRVRLPVGYRAVIEGVQITGTGVIVAPAATDPLQSDDKRRRH